METEKQMLEKMLAEAENEMTQIEGHVNYLRKKLNKSPLASRSLTEKQGAGTGIRADTFFGTTIKEAIIKYLDMEKEPKPVSDIEKALIAGGVEHNSKSLYTTIASVVSRGKDSEFVNIGKNWGLMSWYPGRRAKAQNGEGDVEVNLEEQAEADNGAEEKTERKKK